MPPRTTGALLPWVLAVLLQMPALARAQGGPPFLTNDPGTPGNGNWEINIASMQTLERGVASYQLPQIDLNFGLGERVQLTYEIPYLLQTRQGESTVGGWGNAGGGVDSARNVLPVDPPVINTLPSSDVPDPLIRVAVAPPRAVVIWPLLPEPASVKLPVVDVVSLYSSAVLSASHWKPLNDDAPQSPPGP